MKSNFKSADVLSAALASLSDAKKTASETFYEVRRFFVGLFVLQLSRGGSDYSRSFKGIG